MHTSVLCLICAIVSVKKFLHDHVSPTPHGGASLTCAMRDQLHPLDRAYHVYRTTAYTSALDRSMKALARGDPLQVREAGGLLLPTVLVIRASSVMRVKLALRLHIAQALCGR